MTRVNDARISVLTTCERCANQHTDNAQTHANECADHTAGEQRVNQRGDGARTTHREIVQSVKGAWP
jgi:uncharacterized protein YcbX